MAVAADGSQAADFASGSSKLGKRLATGGSDIFTGQSIQIPFMITLSLQVFSTLFFMLTVVILLNLLIAMSARLRPKDARPRPPRC